MNISNDSINKIIDILKSEISPLFIYLFGSAVEGHFTNESDVDIAFLSSEPIDDYKTFMTAQKIASLIGRDVDLVNLSGASMVFKAQIVGKGEVIYCLDENLLTEFQIRSLKEYTYLNDERKEILNQIKERGEVYE